MSHSTTSYPTTPLHRSAERTAAPAAGADEVTTGAVDAPRRRRGLRVTAVVVLGALVIAATSAWVVEHRSHRPMPMAQALPAAATWCAYNFPAPHDSAAADPNLNTYACRLGFLDGAANPDSDSTPEERRVLVTEEQVGATNPQGMWDIAYLAGWAAGHDAARSA